MCRVRTYKVCTERLQAWGLGTTAPATQPLHFQKKLNHSYLQATTDAKFCHSAYCMNRKYALCCQSEHIQLNVRRDRQATHLCSQSNFQDMTKTYFGLKCLI